MTARPGAALGAALLVCSACGSGCGVLLCSTLAEEHCGRASLGVPAGIAVDIAVGAAIADREGLFFGGLTTALLLGLDCAAFPASRDDAAVPDAGASLHGPPENPRGAAELRGRSLNFAPGRDGPFPRDRSRPRDVVDGTCGAGPAP